MVETKDEADGEKPPSSDNHITVFSDSINGMRMSLNDKISPAPAEEEELDEFGLPIPKFGFSSMSRSRSDSFQSAQSSIDDEEEDDNDGDEAQTTADHEDGAADVEDNDTLDGHDSLNSPIEWPRLSRSTLPATGHVKSSPFHLTPPTTKDEKTSLYAERAKDLIKVSPVSNSVFKRQESPTTISPNTLFRVNSTETVLKSAETETPNEELTTPKAMPPEQSNVIITPPDNLVSEGTETPKPSTDPTDPPKITMSTAINTHSRTSSKASNPESKSANVIFEYPDESAQNAAGASEWSHQLAVIQTQSHTSPAKGRESFDADEWQSMPAYAAYDIYNDDGKLVARQFTESDDEDVLKGGAGKGYTRMNQDEGAQSADSMDENTHYLFQESLDDEDAKTPLSQMQATKELLTEGQRIAYVGLCKLTMVGMLRDVGRVKFKENRAAYESMTLWSQKMMIRLFGHMDISPDEQVMIEQLAEHGVMPADLIPSLTVNVEVANPLMHSTSGSDIASLASQHSIPSSATPDTPSSPPPIQHPSSLTSQNLALDIRWTVLCDLFLVLIADSIYDSRSRVLLIKMGEHLGVEWLDITRFERRVTEALQIQEAGEQNWKEDTLIESRAKAARNRRYMMMGLATLGGGLVIGLSAGLLAPVIGAGLGAAFTTVGIGGTTGFLAGTGGAALITTTGVVTGSSIAGRGMAKRTKNVQTFEFRPLHNNQRVNLLVTVPGWMSSKEDDVRLPFSTLDPVMGDVIALHWEPETLQSMGQTMNLLATEILTQSLQQVLGQTVLVALMSSIQWPVMLTKLSYLIDNPWSTSLDRAASCGLLLADTLIHKHLGQRPISLAGFSLGARVIYYCLLELARVKAHGIIQDVFLFGAPVIIKQKECLRAQSIVAGRFVNGYKRNDWILGYLFRATSTGIGRVAGLRPIENCGDIENLDCTELVTGHLLYRDSMPKLMKEAGFLVVAEEFGEMEDPDPDKHRERQIQLYEEIEEAKKMVAAEEAEAIKAGKKIKKARKSGFLGLWGKEIQAKPSGYDGSRHKPAAEKKSVASEEYDPYIEVRGKVGEKSNGSKALDEDSNVLFDVDKMRDELAANGITMKNLESTLPPLKVETPPPVPPLNRASTTPSVAPPQRTHSPSLPVTSSNRKSAPEGESEWVPEIKDITPRRPLEKLIVDTKKAHSTPSLLLPAHDNGWDDLSQGEIQMSFMPESPQMIRPDTFQKMEPRRSTQSLNTERKPEVKPAANRAALPFERNVWDDDDGGSGGNITMSFE